MQNEDKVFDFPRIKEALKRRGINVEFTGGYTTIRPTDVVFEKGRGNVEFQNAEGEKGIFIKDSNGHYHQVFMYKRDYRLKTYGKPKYHICKCEKIQEFINSGSFRDHYRYANTETVKVNDIDDNRREKEVSDLPLCLLCAKEMSSKYRNLSQKDFVKILKEAGETNPEDEAKEVDIFGYVKEWQKISEAKREIENYTCEKCGYHAENTFDRRFIHIHHKDGNKLNNKQDNLQCLCIQCHAKIDQRHQQNFSKGVNADMLREFEEKQKPLD